MSAVSRRSERATRRELVVASFGRGGVPSPLAGEGVVAKQRRMRGVALSATASPSSARHRIADPRHRQLRRRNHKLVRQPKNPKALISQPDVTTFVGEPLLQDIMTGPVNFDNQSMLEAYKINDIIAQQNLSLKLRAIASPIANRTPDERLRLNGMRPLFAGETAEQESAGLLPS